MRRFFITAICTAFVLSACGSSLPPPTGESSSSARAHISSTTPQSSSEKSEDISSVGPLAVPFSAQAPFANWDALHEEACEEAVLLMLIHYEQKTPFTPEIADREIQELIAWEAKNGYGVDIGMKEMEKIAFDKFGLRASARKEVTKETIINALKTGHPVIIPAAGRELGNPYYSGEGPWYHALVIIGYKKGWFSDTFITNDPGTKRGANYEYKTDVILNAIHDWPGQKERIKEGGRAMLVVET